jgi:hypothetical protein
MQEIYNLDQVKAFIIYQLIDQKYGQAPNTYEDYFGLIRSPFSTGGTYKPAFNTYRFSIEEFKYGYHDLIYSYYLKYKNENRNLLNDSGVDLWAGYLTNGSNWGNILNNILDEDSGYFVQTVFDLLLDRLASQGDITYYVGEMSQQNKTFEWLIANIGSSNEFYLNSLSQNYNSGYGNSVRFIRHAYQKLTNDFPTEIELNNALVYTDLTTNQSSRISVINQILTNSTKYKRKFIKMYYIQYLDRTESTIGENEIISKINSWNGQKSLIKSLLMSDEFWRLSVVKGYCIRQS